MCSPFFLFYFHFTDSFERQRGPKERKVNPPLLVSSPVQHSAGLVLFLFLVYIRARFRFWTISMGGLSLSFRQKKERKKEKAALALCVKRSITMDSIQFLIQLNEEENGNEPTKLLVRHTTAGEVCLCIACPLDVFFRFKFYLAPSSPDLTRLS